MSKKAVDYIVSFKLSCKRSAATPLQTVNFFKCVKVRTSRDPGDLYRACWASRAEVSSGAWLLYTALMYTPSQV
jgi:hypothetical protein